MTVVVIQPDLGVIEIIKSDIMSTTDLRSRHCDEYTFNFTSRRRDESGCFIQRV